MQRRSVAVLLSSIAAVLTFASVSADDTALFGPENAWNTQQLSLGVGCPEFQALFNRAVPGSDSPFWSHVAIQREGYAHVQLHLSKLLLPLGSVMVLRSVGDYDTPDRRRNLTDDFPSGQLYEDKLAPAILAKELWIDFFREQPPAKLAPEPGATDDAQCAGFAVDSFTYALADMSSDSAPVTESICADDNSKEAICYYASDEAAFLASLAVARLLTTDAAGNTRACTGWLLGNSGHLVTNHHCIEDARDASRTTVEFMAEASECTDAARCQSWGACAGTTPTLSLSFKYSNADLDVAIVQLNAAPADLKPFGYLRLQNTESSVGQQVYVPQHPLYYGKRISLVDDYGGRVSILNTSAAGCGAVGYAYSGDTQGGSSGAPVIDAQRHSVVGLHYCGSFCANTAMPAVEILAALSANAAAIGGDPSTFDMVDDGQSRNEANFGTYNAHAQQEAGTLTPRFTFDGGIQVSSDKKTASVDHFELDVSADGDFVFDVLSAEMADKNAFVDVNHDCRGTYLDAVLFLFPKGSPTPVFTADDRPNNGAGASDSSVSFLDPYVETFLKQGSYVLAVAAMGTTAAEAFGGSQTLRDAPEVYNCGKRGDYGSYRIDISSTSSVAVSSKLTSVQIDPGACSKPEREICPL